MTSSGKDSSLSLALSLSVLAARSLSSLILCVCSKAGTAGCAATICELAATRWRHVESRDGTRSVGTCNLVSPRHGVHSARGWPQDSDGKKFGPLNVRLQRIPGIYRLPHKWSEPTSKDFGKFT